MDNEDRIPMESANAAVQTLDLPRISDAAMPAFSSAPGESVFAVASASPPLAPCLLTVAIPVYNERETLREILARVRAVPTPMEIILVDDGSTDGTREILQTEIENRYPDVRVVYHERNQGKGAAIVTAISHATGDFVVVQDADLEYEPLAYLKLLPLLAEGKAEVVYGSRFKGSVKDMKFANLLANRILTLAANILFPGARLTDEATCYKMFRADLLRSLNLRSRRFDFCPEVTAKVLKRGIRIHEVPIDYVARSVTQGKKIRWTDGVDALWALIRYKFRD